MLRYLDVEINRIGLNQGTSGNVSHRTEDGILITPTSLPYDMMKPEDIVALSVHYGEFSPESEARFRSQPRISFHMG